MNTHRNLLSLIILVRILGRIAFAGFATLVLFGAGIDSAQAQTAEVIVHTFAGGATDGNNPQAGLIQATDGNLYGTTNQGGSAGLGTVYELSKDSSGNFTVFTLLHSFAGGVSDGDQLEGYSARLVQASDGNLYGTTFFGGSSTGSAGCPSGCGTIYELSPDGNGNFTVFTLLHSFTSSANDGGLPYGALIQAADGNLYGTTTAGGTINFGTVYELSKDGNGNFTVFTLLRSFSNSSTDGQIPWAGLIQASDGNLYGTTYGGGGGSDGTAYELSKDGNGNFTVFTLLHSFTGSATDGGRPQYASLTQANDGNLYGTTTQGGSTNFGVDFELSKDSSGNFTTFTVIHSFDLVSPFTTDGGSSYGGLIQASDGNLYGTTYYGGSSVNAGTAYELSKDASGNFTTFAILHAFAGGADGVNPYAGLLEPSDGNLYGATTQGGSQDEGVVYELQTGFNFSLSASPNSVTITPGGAAGTSTITVTPINDFTGSVTLSASGLPTGVTASFSPNPTTSSTTLSLTASAGTATGTVTVTITGTSGSLVNTTISLTVNAAATNTAVQSSPNPSVTGQSVTVSFTVTPVPPATGTPTGTVTVSDGVGDSCIATVAAGSCSIVFPTAGTKTLTARYSGDANFNSSTSAAATQHVSEANTTSTIIAQTPNPSAPGQSVTVSFTVTPVPPATGTPTGNVTVGDGVGDSCIATVTAGSCSIVFPMVGTRILTASYAGDSNFNSSTSPGVTQTVNGPSTTTTIVQHQPNPSVTGQAVQVGFRVMPVLPATGAPVGNVTVSDGAGDSCTATVATGRCSIIITTAGKKTLTAAYLGGNFDASMSPGVAQTVSKANTATTIIANSPDPSVTGQSVEVNFTVTPIAPGTGTPTGNVTVSDGKDSCTATVSAGGCSLVVTTTGQKNLMASYAGDNNFHSSTSMSVVQTVDKADTITVITATPNPSVAGQPINVRFTVTPAAPGSGTPTGSVTVTGQFPGGSLSCTATVAKGGCSLIPLPPSGSVLSPVDLTARYAGDSDFNVSTSATLVQVVTDFSISAGPNYITVTAGQSAQYGIALTPSSFYFAGTVNLSCQVSGGFGSNVVVGCAINPTSWMFPSQPVTEPPVPVVSVATLQTGVASSGFAGPNVYEVTFIAKFGTGIPATGGLTHSTTVELVVLP